MGDAAQRLEQEHKAVRLAELRRLLAARQDIPGFRANVEALKAEIARLSGG